MNKAILLLATFLIPLTTNAYDFEYNGLFFNITSLSNATVEVTSGPDYYSGDIVIPNYVSYKGKEYKVTAIGENAFHDDPNSGRIINVKLNSVMTEIGSYAFNSSNIKRISIPSNINYIADLAFDNCYFIEEMIFEDSDEPINLGCGWINPSKERFPFFYPIMIHGGHFEKLYIGRALNSHTGKNRYVTNIYGLSLNYDNEKKSTLKTLIIGDKVKRIEDYSFTDVFSLEEIVIHNNISYIGEGAFMGVSSIESFDIPYNCIVGKSAFANCSSLKNIKMGHVDIAARQFENCTSLTNLEIPSNIESIGEYSFAGCSNLISLTINGNVKTIGAHAFEECKNLTSIKSFLTTPFDIDETTFPFITYLNVPLQVLKGCKSYYMNAEGWKNFTTITDDLEGASINGIKDYNDLQKRIKTIYSPNGKKFNKLHKGINIILLDDGSVKKVVE